MAAQLVVGEQYSPRGLRRILGLPDQASGGGWFAGCQRHGDAYYIFASIRAEGGRKRGERRDHWEGDVLSWSPKGEARLADPDVRDLVSGRLPVHVFWRIGNEGPFTYAGEGSPREQRDTIPATVLWECRPPAVRAALTIHARQLRRCCRPWCPLG